MTDHLEPDFTLGDEDPDDGDPVAIVATRESLPIKVGEVADERTPDGMVCMATYLGDRMIARSVVPPEAFQSVMDRGLFNAAVQLGLAAVEKEPGIQGRLFALVPAEDLEDPEPEHSETDETEPWKASVPSFEDRMEEAAAEEELPEDAMVPLLLGHIVRFKKDRKHPDSLASEAADILQAVVSEERPLTNVVDRLLEDLLDE